MQVERYLQFVEDGEEIAVCGVVKESVGGATVEQHALEAEFAHGAFQLFDGGIGARPRQGSEGGETVGMGGDGGSEAVVHRLTERGLVGGRCVLREAAEREDLHGDAGGVHVGEAFGVPVHAFAGGVGVGDDLRAAAVGVLSVADGFAPAGQVRRGGQRGGHGCLGGGGVEDVFFEADEFHGFAVLCRQRFQCGNQFFGVCGGKFFLCVDGRFIGAVGIADAGGVNRRLVVEIA